MTNEEAIEYFRRQLIESKPRYSHDDLNDIKQCDKDDYYEYHAAIKALEWSDNNK